tara:strand:+ start:125 stop:493 length:369 start_codon:yes stop_codon:yes gene_type:complete
MAAGQYNFTIEQGATLKKQFTYKDSTGAVVDLDNYVTRMQIRTSQGSDAKIADLDNSTLGGLTILPTTGSAVSGTIELHIHADSSSLYSFDQAVYDLEIISQGGIVTRLLQGRIKLSKEVTR